MNAYAPHHGGPLHARPYRGLPPVEINGHALYEFSRELNHSLKELERRYRRRPRPRSLGERKTWQPLPNKPR